MAGDQGDIVSVLRLLQERLESDGFKIHADKLDIVVRKLSASSSLDEELDRLYLVEGWGDVATRLMWHVHNPLLPARPETLDELLAYRLIELYPLVVGIGMNGSAKGHIQHPEEPVPRVSRNLSDTLQSFGQTLEILKRDAYDGELFKGMTKSDLEQAREEARVLESLASSEANHDIARFAAAFVSFITYVIEKDRGGDSRIVNFIGSANLTLQTVCQTVGEEDFDSLNQTIDLLQHPGIFLS